jgi:hypothetical protein
MLTARCDASQNAIGGGPRKGVSCWPMAEAMTARRTVRSQRVNLPAAGPFVNPDSALPGAHQSALRQGISLAVIWPLSARLFA